MSFSQKLSHGWRLFVASFSVIRQNKALLLFPVSTVVLTLLMAGLFLAPIALQPTGHSYSEPAHWKSVGSSLIVEGPPTEQDLREGRDKSVNLSPAALGYLALFYLLTMFLATFNHVAFTHEIFDALEGRPVSVIEGFQFAATKARPIFLWSLFAGIVGLLIRSAAERFGLLGRWIASLIGVAWSVAAVFVIPVLVMEPETESPLKVLRRSASLITKTWGEAVAGYAGLHIGGVIAGLATVGGLIVALVAGIGFGSVKLIFATFVGLFVFLCAFSYVMSVAGQVYLCLLYRFAATGAVPAGMTPEMLGASWKPKKA